MEETDWIMKVKKNRKELLSLHSVSGTGKEVQ
jgi:hypothetical protein